MTSTSKKILIALMAVMMFICAHGASAAPANGSVSPYGCVYPDDNSTYCMLAPIPIPDSTGAVNTTGTVNTGTGFGDYFNGIVKLFMGVIGALAVLMIIVGGIQYMTTVQLSEKAGAKQRILNALLGLLLALSSYIILYAIGGDALVDFNIGVPGTTITFKESNENGVLPSGLPPRNPANVPTGNTVTLAGQILGNSKITLYQGFGTTKSNAKQNILDAANGKSSSLDNGSTVPLDPRMLAGMEYLSTLYPIQVNAIEGSEHATNSRHYQGKAFDIQADPSNPSKNKTLMQACYDAGATEVIGPPGTGFTTNSEHNTHIHCGW